MFTFAGVIGLAVKLGICLAGGKGLDMAIGWFNVRDKFASTKEVSLDVED